MAFPAFLDRFLPAASRLAAASPLSALDELERENFGNLTISPIFVPYANSKHSIAAIKPPPPGALPFSASGNCHISVINWQTAAHGAGVQLLLEIPS
jgi:hypothetical protein